jgi:hypothetical protein
VLNLGIVDLVLLDRVDVELERATAGVVVEAVVIFAVRGLDQQGTAGRLEYEPELLGDAAALARQPQADAAPGSCGPTRRSW